MHGPILTDPVHQCRQHDRQRYQSYDPLEATNVSKHFLIGQSIKFFLPIGQSKASKHL